MNPKKYVPFVPPETDMRELTFKAVFLGIIMAMVLGAANAYLGLKAGMTVAATFPAAVIAMAVLRPFKGTILEENIARTTGAVGEALAAGAIFTIPAFVITGVWTDFYYKPSTILMLTGGILGVLFVIILRRTLVEDQTLPFPESRACAEIVKAGQGKATGAAYVFGTMGFASVIEFLKNPNGLLLIKDSIKGFIPFNLSALRISDITGKEGILNVKGGLFWESPAASPAFLGVGYIIGFRLASITFSGGVFGWLFLMPIVLVLFGDQTLAAMFGSGTSLSASEWVVMAKNIYNATVKPVAVGGMLVGAAYTLWRMRSNLAEGIAKGISDIKQARAGVQKEEVLRTDKDLSFGGVLVAIAVLVIAMIFLYHSFTYNWGSAILAALVMAFAGFVFAAVAGYLVGIIGSSSNPISGLTLSTLLIAALLMVLVGMKGDPGVAAVLAVATVVCVVAGVAGDMMQDWKVGHILGGTPYRMQIGGMFGVIAAALILVLPIMLLHKSGVASGVGGIGSDALPAPQAGLMAMMAKGIVGGEMTWPLVIAGMFFAIALILIGSPSPMLIAVGMYLPFNTTFAIFVGGLIKYIVEKRAEKYIKEDSDKDVIENTGLLLASGLVAGEALTGIIIALLVGLNIMVPKLYISGLSPALGFLLFLVIGYLLVKYPLDALRKRA